MPLSTEIPAPVKAVVNRERFNNLTASMILSSMQSILNNSSAPPLKAEGQMNTLF